jgi:hypothetical protein
MQTPLIQVTNRVTASAASGSYVIDLRGVDRAALALVISGASLGTSTLTLKMGLDTTTFVVFATTKTLAISGATNGIFDLGQINYPYLQVSWTTPSAGVITIVETLYAISTTVQTKS